MIKIAKFGGSSVADAEHFKKIKAIVDADPARRFVVVSACGRRFKGDTKVTDLLYLVNAHVNLVDNEVRLHGLHRTQT